LPATLAETLPAPPAAAETEIQPAERSSSGDDEVMAAIASLAPSNGHGSESVPASGSNGTGQEVPVTATAAVAAEAGITGPRWIAESVAVAVEESAPTLELEMEQAAAGRLTAEAARNDLATAAAVEVQAPALVVEAVEATAVEEASVSEAVAATESGPAPGAIAESVVADSPVAENMVADGAVAESAVPEGVTVESSPVQTSEPVVPKEQSAFAAAAGAGSSPEATPTVEAVSATTVSPEIPEGAPVASLEVAPQREAELAAAWQNWKQIRESFVRAEPSAPVAEPPAPEAITAPEEAPAPVEAEAETDTAEVEAAPSEAPGESTTIASIVDSMLAELRPKLVEEIAKKMNLEKKEKEKKKRK
jgi:hypothetical protein